MEDFSMLDEVKEYFGKDEVYEDRYFHVYHSEYGYIEVHVSTLKSNYGGYLYHVMVTQEETQKTATGNSGRTVRDALIGVHWFDLDK